MAEKLVPKYKNKRRGQVIKRVNRRAPWLKVWLVVILLALGGISLWALSILAHEPEPEPTVAENQSWHRLSDGLTLEIITAETTKIEEIAKETMAEPEPELLPPAVYYPQDAAVEGTKYVALTFDDGPMGETTGRLLEILKTKQARATFFMMGRQMRAYPELVKLAEADGHEIESHSVHHQNLYYMTVNQVQADAGEMRAIFEEILGHAPKYLRPPYGLYNEFVIRGEELPFITWNVDPWDWAKENQDADTVRRKVVTATTDGSIVLLHDIYPSTIDAVPGIIDDLRNFGYEFVTVEELAQQKGVAPVAGEAYRNF